MKRRGRHNLKVEYWLSDAVYTEASKLCGLEREGAGGQLPHVVGQVHKSGHYPLWGSSRLFLRTIDPLVAKAVKVRLLPALPTAFHQLVSHSSLPDSTEASPKGRKSS